MLHSIRSKILFINLSTLAITLLVVLVFSSQKMNTLVHDKEHARINATLELIKLNLEGQYRYLTQTSWAQRHFRREQLKSIATTLQSSLETFKKLETYNITSGNEARSRALAWITKRDPLGRGDKDLIIFDKNGNLIADTLSFPLTGLNLDRIESPLEYRHAKTTHIKKASAPDRFTEVYLPTTPVQNMPRKFVFLSADAAWGWTIGVMDDLSMFEPHPDTIKARLLNLVREMFEKAETGSGGFASLVAGSGKCLTPVTPESCLILHQAHTLQGEPIIDRITSLPASATSLSAVWQGRSYTVSTLHFEPLGWHIVTCTPVSDMQEQARKINISNGIWLALLFFAASYLSLLVTTRASAHISCLARTADKIAEGELDQPIGIFPNDEIGKLARHFERMRSSLKSHICELDTLVQERTIRVNQQNAELRASSGQLQKMVKSLATAKAKAERADQEKSRFLASMSHEIRTPLNAVLGIGQLLQETPLTKKQSDYVQVFQSAGEHLFHLLNDILDLSKVEVGKLLLENRVFALNDLLHEVWSFSPLQDVQKPIQATLNPPDPNIPELLKGDPYRVRQVLLNLLANAHKFTHKGSITLDAALTNRKNGRITVTFSISDTGIGIPPEKQKEIFDRFVQSDSSLSRNYQGAGLGLTISRHLVQLMGGSIEVDSTPGRGSTFTFSIELDIPTPEEIAAFGAAPLVHKQLFPPKRYSLLIAEHSKNNRMLLEFFLEDTPFHVTMVNDGREAVQTFRQGTFDIVLMDLRMPHLDGFAATSAIRKHERETGRSQVPVIALTADVIKTRTTPDLDETFADTLIKPIKKDLLIEVLLQHAVRRAKASCQTDCPVLVDR